MGAVRQVSPTCPEHLPHAFDYDAVDDACCENPVADGDRCEGDMDYCEPDGLAACNSHESANSAWSEWSEYSTCSATCGGGMTQKTRTCEGGKPGQGACIGETEITEDCNQESCPVWNDWSEWSQCSQSCGGGSRRKSRTCQFGEPDQIGCTGETDVTEACNEEACPAEESYCPDSHPFAY